MCLNGQQAQSDVHLKKICIFFLFILETVSPTD